MSKPANQSVRTLLMKGVGDYLIDTIKQENGYTNDLSRSIVRLGAAFMASNVGDIWVAVFEHVQNAGEDTQNAQEVGGRDDRAIAYYVLFDVSGFKKSEDSYFPAENTYELMADIKKAFGSLDEYLRTNNQKLNGVSISEVAHDPGAIIPQMMAEQKISLNPQFVVQTRFLITEQSADPYRLDD